MVAVLLALSASVSVGAADFYAGLLSRRLPAVLVLLGMEGIGLAPVLVVVALSGDRFPDAHHAIAAVLGGLSGCAGLVLFYRGLALGTMSIVAPISATGVGFAVIVGVATGDRPSALQVAGVLVAFAGVVLASRERSTDEDVRAASRTAVALALLAAVGFGGYFVASDVAADGGIPWALALTRGGALPAILVAALATGGLRRLDRRDLLVLTGIAVLDTGGGALLSLANTRGLVSVVSVITALYPVATILLARAVLSERLDRVQGLGVGAALGGVALIAVG